MMLGPLMKFGRSVISLATDRTQMKQSNCCESFQCDLLLEITIWDALKKQTFDASMPMREQRVSGRVGCCHTQHVITLWSYRRWGSSAM